MYTRSKIECPVSEVQKIAKTKKMNSWCQIYTFCVCVRTLKYLIGTFLTQIK